VQGTFVPTRFEFRGVLVEVDGCGTSGAVRMKEAAVTEGNPTGLHIDCSAEEIGRWQTAAAFEQ
jgi:hypothetical protein